MGKYLLLLIGVLVVYALVRHGLRRKRAAAQRKTITEDMVRCAHCGIAVPRGESLTTRDLYFCCAEHQRSHDGKP